MIDKSLFTLPGAGKLMGILAVFGIAQALCVVGEAIGLAAAITNLWYGATVASQTSSIALFLACFLAKQILVNIQAGMLDSYAYKQSSALRTHLLEGVFTTQAQIVTQAGTAHVTASVLEGIDQVETYLRVILPKIVHVVAIPVVLLVCVFRYDWVSAVILLILFPVIVFYMIMLGRAAQARAETQYGTYQRMSNHFIDTLRGIETLKVFGASTSYARTIYEISERFRRATIDTLKMATLSGAVLDLIATMGVGAVAMLLGFRLINDAMPLFNALAVLVLSPEYFKPIREFASDFHASLDGKNALRDITELVAKARDIDTGKPAREQRDRIEIRPWGAQSRLSLHDVCYTYETTPGHEAPPALNHISFTAQGATKIGIVGSSGSGKSTLVGLLGGFALPTQGSIAVDGANVENLRRADWQRNVLYIPQNPYIFHASLRDNIRFYTPEATESDVLDALSVMGLDRLASDLPEGLDTIIGEGARGLSGGQAQRIALARALLDQSRSILLFDEPTAHLDIETEMELKERMLPLMEGRFVLFATHRLHWLSNMDWVVVLEKGCIAEQGTLSELLATDGALTHLVQQAQGGVAS